MQYCIIGGRTWGYEGAQDDIVVITKWLEKNKKRIMYLTGKLGDVLRLL